MTPCSPLNTENKVIVGAFSFVVPPSATVGQTYQINAGNASATSDGVTTPVFIQIVTNGALAGGPVNSVKVVTVGSAQYLVGDAAPFRWFNAGDFGDGTLQANDVSQVFQSAIYYLNGPPLGSDFFDVMDSSDGLDNNLYDGNDTTINNIKFGDGVLAVDDVYVTYRRSLDPSLTWYDRYWSNGIRKQAVAVPNTLQPLSLKVFAASGSRQDGVERPALHHCRVGRGASGRVAQPSGSHPSAGGRYDANPRADAQRGS